MKVFVAIPAYDRRITCETARALLDEQCAAVLSGVELQVGFIPGTSLVSTARDQAVRDFLRSDADRLVFVDSDVAWDEPGLLLKLVSHQVDFVGGCYRYKDEAEGYPVGWLPKPHVIADQATGLVEVASVPGGFMAVNRNVFDRLSKAHPGRIYQHRGEDLHAFFHCPYGGGEDGAFCADWRALGGQVWLDPELTLSHVDGSHKYTGSIGAWLRRRMQAAA